MDADRRSTHELDPEFFGFVGSFLIKIVEDFHVIGDESDGLDDHTLYSRVRMELFDTVAHIGFEPRLMRWAGPTLIDDFPTLMAYSFADQSGRFTQLQFIARVIRHRFRDAVGREQYPSRGSEFWADLAQGTAQAIGLGLDKLGVVESHSGFFNQRGIGSSLEHGRGDIFTVLTTAAVATEHRGKECDRPLASILLHRFEGAREHRVPVAVAPVDGQIDPSLLEFRLQGAYQIAALLIDGAYTSKMVVVLGDF